MISINYFALLSVQKMHPIWYFYRVFMGAFISFENNLEDSEITKRVIKY